MDGVFYVNGQNPEAPRIGRINRDSFCCGARIIVCSNWELYVLGSGSALLSALTSIAPPVAAVVMMKSATMVCLKLKDESVFPGAMYAGKIWDT
jgi:hypothetical protein